MHDNNLISDIQSRLETPSHDKNIKNKNTYTQARKHKLNISKIIVIASLDVSE